MKFTLLCVFGLVYITLADPLGIQDCPPNSVKINNVCLENCAEGTHRYPDLSIGCFKKVPEATCDEPSPVPDPFDICDFSACYCDSPTVRDLATGKCVKLEDCPKKKE